MSTLIDSPASCEIRAVIRFLHAKGISAAEIHRQLCQVYGENIITEAAVRQWCIMFKNGRTTVHDEERSGRPSVVTDELICRVDARVRANRRFTLTELAQEFPEISRSVLHVIVTDKLGYHKFCARWVPKMLTDDLRTKRVVSSLTFLERYREQGDEFLNHIVTGDETWVSYVNVETKKQSMQWGHTRSPNAGPRKFICKPSSKKLMATVFWDRKGVLLVDFMVQGTTITSEVYRETLKKLRRAIQNKRRGLLSSGVVLLHDNARPHTAARTQDLLNHFNWEVFNHPPYSPDLAPSDYHLFSHMKNWLRTQRFGNNDELTTGVQSWLSSQAAEFFDDGIQKLVPRYDKCLNLNGDYVEK